MLLRRLIDFSTLSDAELAHQLGEAKRQLRAAVALHKSEGEIEYWTDAVRELGLERDRRAEASGRSPSDLIVDMARGR